MYLLNFEDFSRENCLQAREQVFSFSDANTTERMSSFGRVKFSFIFVQSYFWAFMLRLQWPIYWANKLEK
jgi:hypothetical protein